MQTLVSKVSHTLALLIAIAYGVVGMPVSAAFLDGKAMTVVRLHQTSSEEPLIQVGASFTVGPGVELEDFGANANPPLSALFDIDVSDRNILITAVADQPFALGESLTFSFGNNPDTVPLVHVLINPMTNWAGLTADRISPLGTAIVVTLNELSGRQGQRISLDIIPEPTAASLAFTSLAPLAASIRRRGRRSRAQPSNHRGRLIVL